MFDPQRTRNALDRLRVQLSGAEGGLPLAALGLLAGLLAGAILVTFRLVIEAAQRALLPDGGTDTLEALAAGGGILVGASLQAATPRTRGVDIVHVLARLAHHQGHLPLRNVLMQFAGATPSA